MKFSIRSNHDCVPHSQGKRERRITFRWIAPEPADSSSSLKGSETHPEKPGEGLARAECLFWIFPFWHTSRSSVSFPTKVTTGCDHLEVISPTSHLKKLQKTFIESTSVFTWSTRILTTQNPVSLRLRVARTCQSTFLSSTLNLG